MSESAKSNYDFPHLDESIEWTEDEKSMILSCVANHIAICCRDGEPLRRTIVKGKKKLEALASFAHEGLGCGFDGSEGDIERWEAYFWRAVEYLSSGDFMYYQN